MTIADGPKIHAAHPPALRLAHRSCRARPTGSYRATRLFNPGVNHWTFSPIIGATYITNSGFEISTSIEIDQNTTNHATNYRSGTGFRQEFAIGQHIGPFTAGLGGYLERQLSNDHGLVHCDGTTGDVGAALLGRKGAARRSHFAGAFAAESLLFSLAAQLERLRPGPIDDHRSPLAVRRRKLSEGRSTAPASRRMPRFVMILAILRVKASAATSINRSRRFTGETGYCMTGVPRAVHRARILGGAYAPPSR